MTTDYSSRVCFSTRPTTSYLMHNHIIRSIILRLHCLNTHLLKPFLKPTSTWYVSSSIMVWNIIGAKMPTKPCFSIWLRVLLTTMDRPRYLSIQLVCHNTFWHAEALFSGGPGRDKLPGRAELSTRGESRTGNYRYRGNLRPGYMVEGVHRSPLPRPQCTMPDLSLDGFFFNQQTNQWYLVYW